jgi:dihydroorotate dehydrogenase
MSNLYEKMIRPILFRLPAETAHEVGIEALKLGLARKNRPASAGFGELQRFGLSFGNPLGVAAGFETKGLVVDRLAELGFGFVEVGTVTCRPQKGNEKPRMFRLPKDKALINRLGFNNDGADKVAGRLLRVRRRKCIVGVNIGKNKHVPNEEAVENYLECFSVVHPAADYVAVNVSSPNTPNLRELQQTNSLEALLKALCGRNVELGKKPLLLKIAPDLTEGEIEAIADACMRFEIDGVIATNTTVRRDGLKTKGAERFGAGGLSGKPLTRRSAEVISKVHEFSKGKLPIIGVGGVFTAQDAFDKIAAGACLIQAYTGFVYGGPSFPIDILSGLAALITAHGFNSLDEAIGSRAVHW